MKATHRMDIIIALAESTKGSLAWYEVWKEANAVKPHIYREDSKGAIIQKCRVMRSELLKVIKELES